MGDGDILTIPAIKLSSSITDCWHTASLNLLTPLSLSLYSKTTTLCVLTAALPLRGVTAADGLFLPLQVA